MLRNLTITAVTALAFAASAAFAAGGGEQHIEDYAFSFEGPFGKFDQNRVRGKIHSANWQENNPQSYQLELSLLQHLRFPTH